MTIETPVRSSSIARLSYDDDAQVLRVTFASGSTYEYAGVTPAQHDDLRTADSIGRHFQQQIRPLGGRKV